MLTLPYFEYEVGLHVVNEARQRAAGSDDLVRSVSAQWIVGLTTPVDPDDVSARSGRFQCAFDDPLECRGVEVVRNLTEDNQIESPFWPGPRYRERTENNLRVMLEPNPSPLQNTWNKVSGQKPIASSRQ